MMRNYAASFSPTGVEGTQELPSKQEMKRGRELGGKEKHRGVVEWRGRKKEERRLCLFTTKRIKINYI